MNIIIAGDGKVGLTLARQLSAEGHDLTLIDLDNLVLEQTMEQYDVMGVQGNCATMSTLEQAGVREANLLIAATNADEVNLLCCMTAHTMKGDAEKCLEAGMQDHIAKPIDPETLFAALQRARG